MVLRRFSRPVSVVARVVLVYGLETIVATVVVSAVRGRPRITLAI